MSHFFNNIQERKKKMKIGFLDSGLGGLTILKEAIRKFPNEYICIADIKNSPYGLKDKKTVNQIVEQNVEYLVENDCRLIVIACNTATSVSIEYLRKKYQNRVIFIGTEPAVKPAVIYHKDKQVIVMATTLTLKEEKLEKLIDSLHAQDKMILMPMDALVGYAEKEEKINYLLAEQYIQAKLKEMDWKKIGSIVLGCTHFPIFKKEFEQYIPSHIEVIDSAEGVTNNMIRHSLELGINEKDKNSIKIITTKEDKHFRDKALKILDIPEENVTFSKN